MGKYRNFRGKFPEGHKVPEWLRGDEKMWQARVDDKRREILDGAENSEDASTTALASAVVDAKIEKNSIKEQQRANNLEIEALVQLVWAAFEGDGVEKVSLANGATVSLKDEPYASIEDKEKFFRHLIETDQTALLSVRLVDELFANAAHKEKFFKYILDNNLLGLLSINSNTMQSIAKDMLVSVKSMPPGLKMTMVKALNFSGMKGLESDNGE